MLFLKNYKSSASYKKYKSLSIDKDFLILEKRIPEHESHI